MTDTLFIGPYHRMTAMQPDATPMQRLAAASVLTAMVNKPFPVDADDLIERAILVYRDQIAFVSGMTGPGNSNLFQELTDIDTTSKKFRATVTGYVELFALLA